MGQLYCNHGLHSQATYLLEWALAGKERFLGETHSSTLSTVECMAYVCHMQRQYVQALEWYQHALEGTEKSLGEGHPDTLGTISNMAYGIPYARAV